MSNLHPIFAAALAPIMPPSEFAVTIMFTSGEYKRRAWAVTAERAKQLALIDARMGSPFGSFAGDVLSSDAQLVSASGTAT